MDVGDNLKDPRLYIYMYNIMFMTYTFNGGVYVGTEAPSGTKGPT